jgi:hypothetical protein
MTPTQRFEEIRVYEGWAERTGVQFARKDVRRSGACCISLAQLARKARTAGDGYFYLLVDLWPPDTVQIAMHEKWIGISSLPPQNGSSS